MNTMLFPCMSWSSPALPIGIPTWGLETWFDFSLHSVYTADLKMASKPFDVHEEERAGSCFLEDYGALGNTKERNNGKEMSVLCIIMFLWTMNFMSFGPLNERVTGSNPVPSTVLGTVQIYTWKNNQHCTYFPKTPKGDYWAILITDSMKNLLEYL